MKLNNISSLYILATLCGSSFALLIGFLMTYNPDNVGFIATLVPLALVWVFLITLLRLAAHAVSRKEHTSLRMVSYILPSVIVLGLMFSALGEMSVLDGVLLFVLAGLGNFYLARTWPK